MAIVTKYDNTTKICHGGVEYLSVWKNYMQYFPDPRTPPTPPVERIEIEVMASGYSLYIPVNYRPRNESWWQAYDWNIIIDGKNPLRRTGVAAASAAVRRLQFSATPWLHHITIMPYWGATYWWAKAFKYMNDSYAKSTLINIIYDESYMWYADSATDTWDYFRAWQYQWCNNLTNCPDEILPSTVTTVWIWFRQNQYSQCASLTSIPNEVLPSVVNSIGASFRQEQYSYCNSITSVPTEVFSPLVTSIDNNFRYWQYSRCTWLLVPSIEVLNSNITSIWDSFRYNQYGNCTNLTLAEEEVLPNTVTSIGTGFRRLQYTTCTSLSQIKWIIDYNIGSGNYRTYQFGWCSANKTVKVLSWVWYNWAAANALYNDRVTQVSVPSAYLQNFIDTTNNPRWSITDSKFIWY